MQGEKYRPIHDGSNPLEALRRFRLEASLCGCTFRREREWIENPEEFAVRNRILLLRSSNGKDIDVALGALPFEEDKMRRTIEIEYTPDIRIRFCSAEDPFIMKTFSDRERDWLDASGIAHRMKDMDKAYIVKQRTALAELKENAHMMPRALHLLGEDT